MLPELELYLILEFKSVQESSAKVLVLLPFKTCSFHQTVHEYVGDAVKRER